MPFQYFRVIDGELVVKGYEPDGDSVRFIPKDPSLFHGLRNEHMARPSKDGSYQLRFEGIDAPELHYGIQAQPLGDKERDVLMKLVGFTNTYSGTKVTKSSPDAVAAHILTKAFDPHGRPIAYVLAGKPPGKAGDVVKVGTDVLAHSFNGEMVVRGAAYSLLYSSTPPEHRAWFKAKAAEARREHIGVWAEDSSPAFKFAGLPSVTPPHGALIFPKLFRRCIDCTKAGYANLGDWLRATPQENDRVIVHNVEVHLSELLVQQNNRVSVQGDILDMLFVEK